MTIPLDLGTSPRDSTPLRTSPLLTSPRHQEAIPMITRSVVGTVLAHELRGLGRHRGLLAVWLGTLAMTEAGVQLTGTALRSMSALLNLVLLVVPLVTLMSGIVGWHAAREFTELLLTQPVRRRALFDALYLALVLPLALAITVGLLLPLAWHRALTPDALPLVLTTAGGAVALVLVFGALALLAAVYIEDRLRGVMAGLVIWALLTVGYDAVVLLVATTLSDYSLERPMLGLMLGNPIDLARITIVLRSDSAALMGYTGAVMQRTLGGAGGTAAAAVGLLAWIAVPLLFARRRFDHRDF